MAGKDAATKPSVKRSKSVTGSIVELVVIVAVALGLALAIQAFVVKPYRIPSGSMEPTLKVHQRILVNRIGMSINGPHVGEIAVFHPPDDAQNEQCGESPRTAQTQINVSGICDETNSTQEPSVVFVKRVVAGPGDEIYVKEGHVYRKAAGKSTFVREHDPYIKPCGSGPSCNLLKPIKIPPGHWFMMGDNRGNSDDSRFWGPVPTGWIIGQAIATYWPPDRIGIF
jgi:signal peptidase I